MADNPITREEQYLAYLNRRGTAITSPITRTEQFLYELCMNGGLGGGTSINILGELASTSELPSADAEKGDALANDQAMLALLALLNFENGKSGAFIFTD